MVLVNKCFFLDYYIGRVYRYKVGNEVFIILMNLFVFVFVYFIKNLRFYKDLYNINVLNEYFKGRIWV